MYDLKHLFTSTFSPTTFYYENSNTKNDFPTEKGEWNLNTFYTSLNDPQIEHDKTLARQQKDTLLTTYAQQESSFSPANILQLIDIYEKLIATLGKLSSFAFLYRATRLLDNVANVFFSSIQDFMDTIQSEVKVFELYLIQLPNETIKEIHNYNPNYDVYLYLVRRYKHHILNTDLEKLMVDKDITNAWIRLFDQTMAQCDFPFQGSALKSTELLNHLFDVDPASRKEAAFSLNKVLYKNISTFSLIYNTLIKDKQTDDRWRRYSNPQDSMHLYNQVTEEMVTSMVQSIESHFTQTSHAYYATKAKLLGYKDSMPHWDRMAPIPQFQDETQKTYTFQEAKEIVLSTYRQFSTTMGDIAQQFFDNQWIDIYPKDNKMPGAFSHPTTAEAHPYILLNFAGKPRDVMTLAHEMGHGIHQMFSKKNGNLMAHAPLVFAETASVFGEMLTFQYLLKHHHHKARKRLLAEKIEDMLATIVRQTTFYKFELECFQQRSEQEITPTQFAKTWTHISKKSYGPAVNIQEAFEHTWSYVPHFIHSPFYVYSYAFGNCMTNALYNLYDEGYKNFEELYIRFLSLGAKVSPQSIKDIFGFDLNNQIFWDQAQQPLIKLIHQLKEA